MGVFGDDRHLVRKFADRLYVFQSLVVPRPFGFSGGAVSLVLVSHARRSLAETVGDIRIDFRCDARRLLSQRPSLARSLDGITGGVLEELAEDASSR